MIKRSDFTINTTRRKKLQEIYDIISNAKECLETPYNEEETYKDSIPENLQNSERYEKAEYAINNIDYAISSLDDALDNIEEIIPQ